MNKSRPRFSISYVVIFFVFNDLKSEMIGRLVDIGGIVDHHSLRV